MQHMSRAIEDSNLPLQTVSGYEQRSFTTQSPTTRGESRHKHLPKVEHAAAERPAPCCSPAENPDHAVRARGLGRSWPEAARRRLESGRAEAARRLRWRGRRSSDRNGSSGRVDVMSDCVRRSLQQGQGCLAMPVVGLGIVHASHMNLRGRKAGGRVACPARGSRRGLLVSLVQTVAGFCSCVSFSEPMCVSFSEPGSPARTECICRSGQRLSCTHAGAITLQRAHRHALHQRSLDIAYRAGAEAKPERHHQMPANESCATLHRWCCAIR